MIGFSNSFNKNYNPLTTQLGQMWFSCRLLTLPRFLSALKSHSLTGKIAMKCMTVVLISACVYGGIWREGERRTREPLSETEGVSLLHLGMLWS